MAAGDKYRAKVLRVEADTVNISKDAISWEVTKEAQEIDTTTFGDTSKTALPDDPDLKGTLTGYNVVGGSDALDLDIGDVIDDLVWYPEGKTTGKPSKTAPAVVLSVNENYEVNGIPGWQMTFKINALPIVGTAA